MRFTDKKVIVTGAASGIGRTTAQHFAAEGAQVYGIDIDEKGLAETAEGAKGSGINGISESNESSGNIHTAVYDISKPENCRKAIDAGVKELSGVDVLANIAGIFKIHHVADVDEKNWNQIMDINLNAVFWMSQACIPHLIKSKGNIVNVASNAGIIGQAYTVPYCVSKGGVILMTKALAMEFIKTDIRVNVIAPGGVKTPLTKNLEMPDQVDFDLINRYTGFRGALEPGNIADVITFIASDAACGINGAVISADTGLIAG